MSTLEAIALAAVLIPIGALAGVTVGNLLGWLVAARPYGDPFNRYIFLGPRRYWKHIDNDQTEGIGEAAPKAEQGEA